MILRPAPHLSESDPSESPQSVIDRVNEWEAFIRLHAPELLTQSEFQDWSIEVSAVPRLYAGSLSLEIDFDKNVRDYARKSKGKKEVFARALGAKQSGTRVLDLSMGLGIDAVFARSLGFEVTGLERNPVMYLLLNQAIHQTQREDLQGMKVLFGDIRTLVESGNLNLDQFEILYFDPMYPEVKNKSALPRKEMQIFRALIGGDGDSREVLQFVRSHFSGRIVVKRPLKAEDLGENPIHRFLGTTVRYDLYRGGL